MVKVIKEGRIPQKVKKIYTHTCNTCGCKFEFEETDCEDIVQFVLHYSGFIKCPTCGTTLTIDLNNCEHREESDEDLLIQIKRNLTCPKCNKQEGVELQPHSFKSVCMCKYCGYLWTR